jgi:hypothetical protein
MFDRLYELKQPVVATSVDDREYPRFPDDTPLPAGTAVRIVSDKAPWRPHPDSKLFYTIEVAGADYKVNAEALDAALGEVISSRP